VLCIPGNTAIERELLNVTDSLHSRSDNTAMRSCQHRIVVFVTAGAVPFRFFSFQLLSQLDELLASELAELANETSQQDATAADPFVDNATMPDARDSHVTS